MKHNKQIIPLSPITVSLITSPMFLMCKFSNFLEKKRVFTYSTLCCVPWNETNPDCYIYFFYLWNSNAIFNLSIHFHCFSSLTHNCTLILGSVKSISISKLNDLLPMAHFVFVFTKKKKNHNKICKTFTYSYVSMCCLLLLWRNQKKKSVKWTPFQINEKLSMNLYR